MVFVKQHFPTKLKKIYALKLCVKNHWIIQQQKPPPLNFKVRRRIHKGIELNLKWDTLIWTISTLPTQPHPPCRKGSSTYTRANGSKTTTFTLSLFMTQTRGEGNIKFQTVYINDIFRSFCPQAMNTRALYLYAWSIKMFCATLVSKKVGFSTTTWCAHTKSKMEHTQSWKYCVSFFLAWLYINKNFKQV